MSMPGMTASAAPGVAPQKGELGQMAGATPAGYWGAAATAATMADKTAKTFIFLIGEVLFKKTKNRRAQSILGWNLLPQRMLQYPQNPSCWFSTISTHQTRIL